VPVTRSDRPRRARLNAALGLATGLTLAAGFAAVALPAAPARAQADGVERSPTQLLEDFIHFVLIANYEVAGGVGRELLASGLSDGEFVDLIDGLRERDRFDKALARAARVEQLEDVAAALETLYRRGKLARSRNPEEIARNIEMLTGQLLQRLIARERLQAAGEYALPQLLDALLDSANPARRAEVTELLVEMGRPIITPLGTALLDLSPEQQELVVSVLGRTEQRTALPYVVELLNQTDADRAREATSRAVAPSGRVWAGSAGPDGTTTGQPTAAARCAGPESLATTASYASSPPARARRSVRPPRSCATVTKPVPDPPLSPALGSSKSICQMPPSRIGASASP